MAPRETERAMREPKKPEKGPNRLIEALLVETVRNRQSEGKATSLRDLHVLLDVPQPVALQVARRLENEGTLLVSPDPLDTLASAISVRKPIASYMQFFSSGPSKRK